MDEKEIRKLIKEKGVDNVDWTSICMHQILSESFIKEFKNYVDWDAIFVCQKLSENFIKEMKNYVNWAGIFDTQDSSESFKEEMYRVGIYTPSKNIKMNYNIKISK